MSGKENGGKKESTGERTTPAQTYLEDQNYASYDQKRIYLLKKKGMKTVCFTPVKLS